MASLVYAQGKPFDTCASARARSDAVSRSPTGIVPEALMNPGSKREVMAFLATLPVEGGVKVDLLVGWARMVGVSVNAAQRDMVRNTGVDYQ